MTDIQDRLFDVSEYGGTEPTAKEKSKPPKPEPIVEPWQEPWVLLRGRSGVLPFFHLEAGRNEHGAVASVCGIVGTRITNDMVTQMIRCPLCDMGAQLA